MNLLSIEVGILEMIESDSPIYQTLLGTLFTWGMTAAGAGLVVVISGTQVLNV